MSILFIVLCAFGFILYLANRIDKRVKKLEHTFLRSFAQLRQEMRKGASHTDDDAMHAHDPPLPEEEVISEKNIMDDTHRDDTASTRSEEEEEEEEEDMRLATE